MKRREFVAGSSAALALGGLVSAPASAQAGFQEGRHYVRLQQPVPVSAPAGKIEVLEFFWYGCPHCNAFEPTLDWSVAFARDVMDFAEREGNNVYLMPIKTNLEAYLEGVLA